MNTPLLHLEKLSFGFRPNDEVLKDVTFSLFSRQFVAIIGPNGSGKSTLLKLILKELMPTKGKLTRQPHLKIAYVPQKLTFDTLFPITVLDVVLGGCFTLQNKEEAAKKALEEVGLLHLQDSSFGTLSLGQAQRVLMARALAQEPTLLLLDEPTASVDKEAEDTILRLLISQKRKGAILMVTHHIHSILSHVDGILCLQQKVVLMKPKEVCEHFALGLYHEPLINMNVDHFSKGQK